jgi:hypothetical protein
MTAARHIARQTAISIVINMVLSAFFFLLLFGGQEFVAVWGVRGLAADFVPQSFMITLMSVLMPGLASERKLRAAQLIPLAEGTRLPRHVGLRALVLAVPAALAGGAGMAAVLGLAGVDAIAWAPALGFKIAYGGLLGSIVTPIGLRAALARRHAAKA